MIIPALNEEGNLSDTVSCVKSVSSKYFNEIEILIFDDGSTDDTGKIAKELALTDEKIRVITHTIPINIGGCYKEGIQLASTNYLILVPGDNECAEGVLERVLSKVGQADMIIPYTDNANKRTLSRRLISEGFVKVINYISNCNLRYYNGAVLHKTLNVRSCQISSDGFSYQAEVLTQLIKRGCTYLEVPTEINPRKQGKSKAGSLKNILDVVKFLVALGCKNLSSIRQPAQPPLNT